MCDGVLVGECMTDWKNRLSSEIKLVPAHELLANPMNARRHPARQREALRGSLDTLGWVAPVFVGKSGYLLDGHARVEEALSKDENTLIPVIEVDLEAHEESLFLASFDYITYLAEYDRDSLDALLQDVQTDDNRLQAMLGELAVSHGVVDGFDAMSEWQGMPEFEQESINAFKTIQVHFKSLDDLKAFAELVGQTVTENTRSIYYPEQIKEKIKGVYVVQDES